MTAIRLEPLEGPNVWRAADLEARSDWRHQLTSAELDDLETALVHARATGKPTTSLTRADFPLPILAPAIARWMQSIQRGPGFMNVRGLPLDRHEADDVERIHWGLGTHLGVAVSQNAAGDLISHVRDVGANASDRSKRLYKTNVELGFHSDGSDIAVLTCVAQSPWGGRTRLASCGAIYNEILVRRPDLVPLLYERFAWDRHGDEREGEAPFFELPICSVHDDQLRFFYIGWYIRNAQRHADAPRLSAEQVQLLDLIDEIANDPAIHVEFRLEPGELNALKNSAALHMRTAFEDGESPDSKRHLLRLWLTAHGEWADVDAFVQQGIPVKQGAVSDEESLHTTE